MWGKMSHAGNNSLVNKEESSDGIRSLLGKHIRILLKCQVKLESKGDRTENRILVFCPCRLFCVKIPNPRIDFHFHYLEIKSIESKKVNQLMLTVNDKSHSFLISEPDKVDLIDKMILTLLTAVSDTFPGIPMRSLIRKIDVIPHSRLASLDFCLERSSDDEGTSTSSTPLPCPKSKSTSSLSDEGSSLINSSSSSSATLDKSMAVVPAPASYHHFTLSKWGPGGSTSSPCGGFSTQYAWLCDLHGMPYREEVAWDVDTIYLSHDSRELCLRDFDHLEPRDSVPILAAMEYNSWFKGLRLSSVKLSHEAIERFFSVIRKSLAIEEIYLDNIGAKADFALKLSSALSANCNSQVHTLDLSHNMIEDKGAIHLSNSLAKLCRGPMSLNFSHCGLSAKGVAQLAHALVLNRTASTTLTHLNLSGNSLKEDINNLCNFLAQPNSVTVLDLSGTDCSLETVFGALLRGCTTHLATLNLTRNNFAAKKGKEIPPSFKQFLTSSLTLKHLSLSGCKLSLDALKQLLLGLACNESAADVDLDVSSNPLGSQGAQVLESCIPTIKCLSSLDISDTHMEAELAAVVGAANKNKSLKHLHLGRNLQTKPKHIAQVMEAVVQVLQDEECVLETLSLADSKLKAELYTVINALGSNQCLENINISGNQMGDVGARLLAKALQINSKIRSITYDKNSITLQGFSDIAYGLESNVTVRHMPFPVHDSTLCMKVSAEKTENVMKKIQDLVFRNTQPKKITNGHQAFRLQQGFLLSSAQQTVDKLINQTQESIKQLKAVETGKDEVEESRQRNVISQAEIIIRDAERAKQLVLNLYEILEPKGEGVKSVESKLQQIADELQVMLSQHIEGNIEQVIKVTEEKCPNILSSEVKAEIKEGCFTKSKIGQDFVRRCVVDLAGTDITNKLNEVHLSVAAHISDKLVDTTIESLMKCQKQLNDLSKKRSSTPDVLRTRLRSPSETAKETDTNMIFDSSHLSDQSPMKLEYLNLATPQLSTKRRGLHGRRIRPKSVVDCIEGISADDIPDLLPTLPKTIEETISNLVELPPVSPQQLKHLGKARPKKPKTRAPTRPGLRQTEVNFEGCDTDSCHQDCLSFFRPSSATPTAEATPDSDECSTSLMISSMTSAIEEPSLVSTPTHSSRTFKADDNSNKTSPSSFDSASLGSKLSLDAVPRSKSSDCLEKQGPKSLLTPTHNSEAQRETQKSPIPKSGVSVGVSVLAEMKARQEKRSSAAFLSGTTTSEENSQSKPEEKVTPVTSTVNEAKEKFLVTKNSLSAITAGLVNRRPPPVAPKPRPWSTVSSDRRSGDFSLGSDGSSPHTPDSGEILEDEPPAAPETVSLPPPAVTAAPASSVSSTISSNPVGVPRSGLIGSRGSGVGFLSSSPGKVHAESSQSQTAGPVSLPPEGTVSGTGNKFGWSVKKMAASLTRQQSTEDKPKKSDSLPRNVSPPTSTAPNPSDTIKLQETPKARISIQEWGRSASTDWRAPLKKVSADLANRTISKRWEVSTEEKS